LVFKGASFFGDVTAFTAKLDKLLAAKKDVDALVAVRTEIEAAHAAGNGAAVVDEIVAKLIWAVKIARKPTDIFFRNKYIHRSVMLKVVAAVPEMVSGLIRHIKSLQGMRHDGGWMGHLLHEAENERIHLMTWMEVSKPVLWERALIATVHTGSFAVFPLLYMVSPRTAHRVVGYLEEEAVTSYTHFIGKIDAGRIENVKAPDIAVAYWNLDPESTLRDVVLAVRADEALHRDTNHHFSDRIRAKRESLFEDMGTNSNKPHIKY
ncbi:inducible alternative oxidase 2, partial [Coemansia sp. RSA 2131]